MPDSAEPTRKPYVSALRAAAANEKRERVVAAATQSLREDGGLGGFSLESVAKAAGVTRLTVYNQFGSRRVLLEAVFDHYAVHGGLTRLGEVMAMPDPRAGLNRLVEIFCDFWSLDHEAFASLLAMGGADAEFETALQIQSPLRNNLTKASFNRARSAAYESPQTRKRDNLIGWRSELCAKPFCSGLPEERRSCRQVRHLHRPAARRPRRRQDLSIPER